jgi:hypothetical protein
MGLSFAPYKSPSLVYKKVPKTDKNNVPQGHDQAVEPAARSVG